MKRIFNACKFRYISRPILKICSNHFHSWSRPRNSSKEAIVYSGTNIFCIHLNSFLLQHRLAISTCLSLWKKGMNSRSRKEFKEANVDKMTEIEDIENETFNSLLIKSGDSLAGVSRLAVIQPWVKWGVKKRWETTPDILLNEACALVKSIPYATVSYQEYVPVQKISSTHIFGSGTLERLVSDVRQSASQAVFISVDYLTRVQKSELQDKFGMRVFDRYFVVLSVFKHHASTLEARLQIAMAELPFVSKRHLTENEKRVVDQRESSLKSALNRISGRRERVRKARQKACLPAIAVVGYTNCGKTTLIRALAGDESLKGEDRLFATLDVTAHRGRLPCGLNAVFIDTVGFIQDIPTSLIASFTATLEDAIYSDVVVVVRDVSHPDIVGQMKTVEETLKSLPLSEETPIIAVNNKADLVTEAEKIDKSIWDGGIIASAITGQGLNEVLEEVEKELLRVTERCIYNLRLLTGSYKITWLKQNVGVCSEEVDRDNPQYTHVQVVLNEAELAAFRKVFIK